MGFAPEGSYLLGDMRYQYLILKRYKYWTLYLNENQFHIGRAYAWYTVKHIDMHPFEILSLAELSELQKIMAIYRTVLRRLFGEHLLNAEWLGNEIHLHRGHGHMHFVPRYPEPVLFEGRVFTDERFGKRSTYEKLVLPKKELLRIRDDIRERVQSFPAE